ncbi:MAG TPA: hypothetical protein VIM65_16975 [Cyclobacteriaceae bacterium]
MEAEPQPEVESTHAGLSNVEQHCFQTMTKDEIIEKYIEMKSKATKAEKDAELYYSYILSLQKKYDTLKSKYPDIKTTDYDLNWSWVNKIVFVLKKTDRPLQSSEIIDLLMPHEPGLKSSRYRPQSFSPNLGKAVKYKRVIAYKLGGTRGYYYVLPEWMHDQHVLLKNYEDKILMR